MDSEEVEKFWRDNIQGEERTPKRHRFKDILLKFNRHTDGKIVEVNDAIFSDYQKLKEVKKEMDKLDEIKTELEERIKLGFGDAEAISYGGQTLATWKAPKPSMKFDDKAFKAAHPEMVSEFSREVQGARRFLLKIRFNQQRKVRRLCISFQISKWKI